MSKEPLLLNRRILLTGASGSIGRATALRLTEAGAHVVLNGRDVSKLEQVASALPPGTYTVDPFDLAKTDEIPGWIKLLAEKDGPFAGIAHTAGIQITKPLRQIDASFIDTMFNLNITSGIMLGKSLRQRLCHTDKASFVLISGMAARMFAASNVIYAASKGGVVGATKAMAHELLRDGIRVNCITPSLVESEIAERAKQILPKENWDAVIAKHPLGIGHPDDVAHGIVYLLSDQTSWMTGSDLQIDGGFRIA